MGMISRNSERDPALAHKHPWCPLIGRHVALALWSRLTRLSIGIFNKP